MPHNFSSFSLFRLAVFERMVYWSDSTKQGILQVNKFQGKDSINRLFIDQVGLKNTYMSVHFGGKLFESPRAGDSPGPKKFQGKDPSKGCYIDQVGFFLKKKAPF
jgi:hypothetical protein